MLFEKIEGTEVFATGNISTPKELSAALRRDGYSHGDLTGAFGALWMLQARSLGKEYHYALLMNPADQPQMCPMGVCRDGLFFDAGHPDGTRALHRPMKSLDEELAVLLTQCAQDCMTGHDDYLYVCKHRPELARYIPTYLREGDPPTLLTEGTLDRLDKLPLAEHYAATFAEAREDCKACRDPKTQGAGWSKEALLEYYASSSDGAVPVRPREMEF
jgi:hypothetical protein